MEAAKENYVSNKFPIIKKTTAEYRSAFLVLLWSAMLS